MTFVNYVSQLLFGIFRELKPVLRFVPFFVEYQRINPFLDEAVKSVFGRKEVHIIPFDFYAAVDMKSVVYIRIFGEFFDGGRHKAELEFYRLKVGVSALQISLPRGGVTVQQANSQYHRIIGVNNLHRAVFALWLPVFIALAS